MEQPPSGEGPTDQIVRTEVACCIAGCGPAGAMLGLLLARAAVEVLVLEKHADFLRDFRGDTLHRSTLQLFDELGLGERLLDLPHQKAPVVGVTTDAGEFTLADFRALSGRHRYIAFMPQLDFLDFVVGQAQQLPTFRLRMRAEALGVLEEAGRVVGLTYRDQDGSVRQVRAQLTVAADGRDSGLRRSAGLRPRAFGAPVDVLWFRLSRRPDDPTQSFGRLAAGHLLVLLDRGGYWQIAYVIPKDAADKLHEVGLARFRASVAELVPFLADRVGELRSWDDVRVLRVHVDRLRRWFRPGLLCIGDAAHAMSPIGGVGINLAVHDAVATANLLTRARDRQARPGAGGRAHLGGPHDPAAWPPGRRRHLRGGAGVAGQRRRGRHAPVVWASGRGDAGHPAAPPAGARCPCATPAAGAGHDRRRIGGPMSGDRPVAQPTMQVIQVWQEPSRLWRWMYLEPSGDGRPLAIMSNKEFETREAALRSATTAYPGVLVTQPRVVPGPPGGVAPATACCWPCSPWRCWCWCCGGDGAVPQAASV